MRKKVSAEKIEAKSEEFIKNNNCTVHKIQRKRLAKLIFNLSKNDSSNLLVIPYLARFIAIINQHFPETGTEIVALLHTEFQELQADTLNDLTNYEVKIRNVRFIGELCKFGIMFENTPLRLIKDLRKGLDDFSGHNIEIVCNLLESCGRYLVTAIEPSYLA
jgi:regulator of nonsense transcripts 2